VSCAVRRTIAGCRRGRIVHIGGLAPSRRSPPAKQAPNPQATLLHALTHNAAMELAGHRTG
jgi:hypothetical protein